MPPKENCAVFAVYTNQLRFGQNLGVKLVPGQFSQPAFIALRDSSLTNSITRKDKL